MQHSIDGVPVPHTRSTRDVLLQLNVLKERNTTRRPPDLLRLLLRGCVRYKREQKGRDHYLTWWGALETSASVRAWLRYRKLTWGDVSADWPRWFGELETALLAEPAQVDCEDLAAFGAVSLPEWGHARAAWVACKEVGAWGVLAGWHAEVLKVSTKRIPGEVPMSGDVFVLTLEPIVRLAGEEFGEWDPSYVGGMGRPDMEAFKHA